MGLISRVSSRTYRKNSNYSLKMADHVDDNDLLDYEENEEVVAVAESADQKKDVKGTYVSVHGAGFRDFLLKPEMLKAIQDCGFEHPSEVQNECIPQAVLGMVVLCHPRQLAFQISKEYDRFSKYLNNVKVGVF